MKGHLEPRGKNRWKIILELGVDAEGKRQRRVVTLHGAKREAEAEMIKLLRQMQTGTFVEARQITVSDYLRRWLTDYAANATARRTYLRYQEIVELHLIPALGALKLSSLRPLHVQAYYTEALKSGRRDGKGGLSAQTVLHHHRVLKTALRQAVRWQVLAVNPTDAVTPPKPQRQEVVALTQDETVHLLVALDGHRLYLPAVVAVTTGMREGEVLGLRWRDVDLEASRLQVRQTLQNAKGELFFKSPKSERGERSIALMPMTVEALRKQRAAQNERRLQLGGTYDDQDLVMCRDDGRPWHPGSFAAEWRKGTRELGIQVKFHNLRHTHATLLLVNGEHPKVVQERLGHSSIGITMDTYSHVIPSMQIEAASKLETSLGTAFLTAMKQSS